MRLETVTRIILELLAEVTLPGPLPADARAGRFFRARRFIGAKERRLLADSAFAWLRHVPRARARWGVRAGLPAQTGDFLGGSRTVHLLDTLALASDGLLPLSFAEAVRGARPLLAECQEQPEAPAVLDALATALADPSWPGADAWPPDPPDRLAAELSLPRWLADALVRERGEPAARALGAALLTPAPVDLRANTLLGSRDAAREDLERELGVTVEATPWSPAGLRLRRRVNLAGTRVVRSGTVEVEDEGSQIVALALDLRPGQSVIDACAGAGGKTLAMAASLLAPRPGHPAGSIAACDVSASKLQELERRARRAGVHEAVRTFLLAPGGPLPGGLGPADVILIDAPCSGTGTLRRNPELKLRHGPGDVARFADLQRSLLERFLPLLKPGGRIAYATCSLLAAENEEVAGAFAAAHPELEESPSTFAATHLPPACVEGGRIRIDPASAGTDGFFMGVWRRRAP
jgi:16S rRNA (cytosine967-C5)-methyltransferase